MRRLRKLSTPSSSRSRPLLPPPHGAHCALPRRARAGTSRYPIDILVHPERAGADGLSAGPLLAVEVDGPSHFLRAGGGGARARAVPTGATRLKRRLLGALGYRVVSIPYWEWDAMRGDPARERAYVLAACGGRADSAGGGGGGGGGGGAAP
jgi:hypothetical protein